MVLKGFDIANDYLTGPWLQTLYSPGWEAQNLLVDMLRLDLIHPQISGNKWLKLEGWLTEFEKGSYQGIITTGGPWSNHLHACGYACHINSIPLKVVVKSTSGTSNPMLNDLEGWGVEQIPVNRALFFNSEYWKDYAQQHNFLWIPMGGEGMEGEQGITRWMNELPLEPYDYIFTAVGTATTLAGIAKSRLNFQHLIGVDPGTGDKELLNKMQEIQAEVPQKNIELIKCANRFGKLTEPIREIIYTWKTDHQVPLDFVYTAPLCLEFTQMVRNKKIETGSRTLLIHSGGLQGNRSHPELLTGS